MENDRRAPSELPSASEPRTDVNCGEFLIFSVELCLMGLPIAVRFRYGKNCRAGWTRLHVERLRLDQLIRSVRHRPEKYSQSVSSFGGDRARAGVDQNERRIERHTAWPAGSWCIPVPGDGDVRLHAETARRRVAEIRL